MAKSDWIIQWYGNFNLGIKGISKRNFLYLKTFLTLIPLGHFFDSTILISFSIKKIINMN